MKVKETKGRMPDLVILPANIGRALLCLGFILGPGSSIFALRVLGFLRGVGEEGGAGLHECSFELLGWVWRIPSSPTQTLILLLVIPRSFYPGGHEWTRQLGVRSAVISHRCHLILLRN